MDRICHVFSLNQSGHLKLYGIQSDHSIENMICRTLQHFSRGFKRQNLFPVSMKEFQCQMDSSDLFTKIYIFSIHLKNSDSDGFRWPFDQEYSF